jgi:hypothetical protein
MNWLPKRGRGDPVTTKAGVAGFSYGRPSRNSQSVSAAVIFSGHAVAREGALAQCPATMSSSVTSRASSTCSVSSAPNAAVRGVYYLHSLIEKNGRKGNMMKWREQLNGDCPRRDAHSLQERCDLICPDLPKVL